MDYIIFKVNNQLIIIQCIPEYSDYFTSLPFINNAASLKIRINFGFITCVVDSFFKLLSLVMKYCFNRCITTKSSFKSCSFVFVDLFHTIKSKGFQYQTRKQKHRGFVPKIPFRL
jgi:hypothetical protein